MAVRNEMQALAKVCSLTTIGNGSRSGVPKQRGRPAQREYKFRAMTRGHVPAR